MYFLIEKKKSQLNNEIKLGNKTRKGWDDRYREFGKELSDDKGERA